MKYLSQIFVLIILGLAAPSLFGCSSGMMPSSEDGGGGGGSDLATQVDMRSGNDGAGGGASGLVGFCEHYKKCGGSFYETAEACVRATLNYWKECRRPELDTFGSCMLAKVPCAGWNPDAYNPASTPCAAEWAAMRQKMCN